MRVLVACEFSGIVREAFAKCGHDAWSCDLLPTEIEGQYRQELESLKGDIDTKLTRLALMEKELEKDQFLKAYNERPRR